MKTLTNFHIPAMAKLFYGLTHKEATEILAAIGAVTISYSKGETIIEQWTKATHHYLVVSGEVHSYYNHENGRRSVNGVFKHGESFGLVFAFSDMRLNPSSAIAYADSIVIKIPIVDIINNDFLIETRTRRIYIQNAVNIISQAAFKSRLRSFVLEQSRIEDRLLTYLNEKAKHVGSNEMDVPFDRQELADFLACERSSLCTVLGKMKDKGVIDFSRNHFTVRKPA